MVRVRLEDIWMSFGKLVVLKGINLDVEEGEFLTLLGPSGCGKTTLLRIIAGLYRPIKGRIYFNEEDVTDLPPWKRNIGFVFQDYALWPHMTIFDNIAYGLKLRRLPKQEIRRRVKAVMELLGLEGLENRYPHQLSGGQQQRVALARAIVINPSLLLLDEPLSNLDAKIRISVRTEIKKLQKKLKITTIYVTHDQEEALVISDRIAVLNQGVIEQVDTPLKLYYSPRTLFVADFIGQVNIFPGKITNIDSRENLVYIETPIGELKAMKRTDIDVEPGEQVHVVFRPENIDLYKSMPRPEHHETVLKGVIDTVHFLGNLLRLEINVNDNIVKAEIHNPLRRGFYEAGKEIFLKIEPVHVVILKK